MGAVNLVVFDIAGTTAKDDGLVLQAAQKALVALDIAIDSPRYFDATQHINQTMGQRKIDVFLHIFQQDLALAEQAHELFVANYQAMVAAGGLSEFEGVSSLFHALATEGIGVAITTGFPRVILDVIIEGLGWADKIDSSVAADEVAQGRPAPDMILRSIENFNRQKSCSLTPAQIAVVGDTESDMQSGVRAGAKFVIGVTTGAHEEQALVDSGATHVLHDVTKVFALVS